SPRALLHPPSKKPASPLDPSLRSPRRPQLFLAGTCVSARGKGWRRSGGTLTPIEGDPDSERGEFKGESRGALTLDEGRGDFRRGDRRRRTRGPIDDLHHFGARLLREDAVGVRSTRDRGRLRGRGASRVGL